MAAPTTRRFLVLHGWQNRRPPAHWQWQLVEALRQNGEQVLYPQFPDPDQPSLDVWTELLRAELAQLGSGERIVIAHSLAVPLWVNAAPGLRREERVNRVLLVAPPSPQFLRAQPEVAAFGKVHLDPAATNAADSTRLVATDNDSYCPEGALTAYASINADGDVITGGGHLDPVAGYGNWPSVLEWCLDPSTRLTARDAKN
jgi:predicted alpha/beta hydrolase family esterase